MKEPDERIQFKKEHVNEEMECCDRCGSLQIHEDVIQYINTGEFEFVGEGIFCPDCFRETEPRLLKDWLKEQSAETIKKWTTDNKFDLESIDLFLLNK